MKTWIFLNSLQLWRMFQDVTCTRRILDNILGLW
jgi:hypothetical protein